MRHLTIPYPPPPPLVPVAVTAPSARFKKEVIRVLGAIILFFLVYILMMILSLALAAGCVYGGVMLIINLHNLYVVFFGLGIIGLGLMVLFFLVKFIFAVSKFDHSGSLEVTETDQPALYAFIGRLARETKTPLPRKIFLSPEVNACVFYNSGFWSMLLPVKKNLIEKFIDTQYAYFSGNSFFDNELNELYRIVKESCRIVTEYWFVQYKILLEIQLDAWQ